MATIEFISAGRIVEKKVHHQMEAVKRTNGMKKTAVKGLEPVMVQCAIGIDITICERSLSAVTAPGVEAIYRVMYITIAQLTNQTSSGVARVEAFTAHKGLVFVSLSATRGATFGEARRGWQYQK